MPSGRSLVDELEKLAGLRDDGAITNQEFDRRKSRLLETASSDGASTESSSQSRRPRDLRGWWWRLGAIVVILVVAAAIVIGVPQIRRNVPGIQNWFGGSTATLHGLVFYGVYQASTRGYACSSSSLGYATTVTIDNNVGTRVAMAGLSQGSVGPSDISGSTDSCVFTFSAVVPAESAALTIAVGNVDSLTFSQQTLQQVHWSVAFNLDDS
jgi:hypothetical protein